jgi:PAS domain-containing protein
LRNQINDLNTLIVREEHNYKIGIIRNVNFFDLKEMRLRIRSFKLQQQHLVSSLNCVEDLNRFQYSSVRDLPVQEFHAYNFSVHITDRNWNYLFMNKFVEKAVGVSASELIGQNVWKRFPEHIDHHLIDLRLKTEDGIKNETVAISAATHKKVALQSIPFADGFVVIATPIFSR